VVFEREVLAMCSVRSEQVRRLPAAIVYLHRMIEEFQRV
jgi:hypothetical protein